MVKRQFRMVTGLTGLLAATGINALLNDHGDAWVGSAYAQDGESLDEDADAEAIDESSAEEAAADEPMAESAVTEDASGTEAQRNPRRSTQAGSADDSALDRWAPADNLAMTSGAASAATADAPAAAPPQEGPPPEIASTAPDSTRQKIREYILKNFLFSNDNKALGDRDSLVRGGILDSTGIYEMIMWIEEQFGFTIAPEEMVPDNFDTIESMAAFIARKKA